MESTDVMKLNLNCELEINIYLIWKGELVVVGRAVENTCLESSSGVLRGTKLNPV